MGRALGLLLFLLLAISPAQGQQSERFGPYELHYSVVNTTFIEPAVAANYGITRGDKRAILNLSLREHVDTGTVSRPMQIVGTTWDLIHKDELVFQEVREGEAIYYIAQFEFINEEWRFFQMHFRPEGHDETLSFQFRHQLYTD